MNKKHIITSGCSYSDVGSNCWPKFIKDYFDDLNTYNYGSCSRGSDYISRTIISGCQKLIDRGVNVDDIFVLVGWSGMQRRDMLVNNESKQMYYEFKNYEDVFSEITYTNNLPIGIWQAFNEKWSKFLPDEQSYILSMENILRTQWYLESNQIEYKFFSFVNIFDYHHYFDVWTDDYDLSKQVKINKIFPSIDYLFKMVDWNRWWFWKDYGGIGNWILDNVKGGYNLEELDGILGQNHPNKKGHMEFCEKVIVKFIKEWSNKND